MASVRGSVTRQTSTKSGSQDTETTLLFQGSQSRVLPLMLSTCAVLVFSLIVSSCW